MKRLKFLFLMSLLTKVYNKEQIDFTVAYFMYKNVSNVIGFSCKDNILLSRKFSELGTKVAFPTLNSTAQINDLLKTYYWQLGVFLDLDCYDNTSIRYLFSEATNRRFYGESHFWLVVTLNLDLIKSTIDDEAFGLSTDFVIALSINGSRDYYELYDVYNPWKKGGGMFNITFMGYWNKTRGLDISLNQSKFRRRSNLHGMKMNAAFFGSKYRSKNMTIENYLQDYTTQSKDGLSKFGFNILVHFSEMFNITFNFSEVQTWKKGDSVGPLSRALIQNEIQITGSPIVMTIERLHLIKFVYPAWPFRTCFIFRNPQPKDIKVGEVLHPFSNESWMLTSIFFLIFIVALSLVFSFEKQDLADSQCSNSFIVVMSALCQQGTSFIMDRISTRILFLHLLIFSFLIYNYYSASIVSARLNEPIIKINDSLNELAKTELKMSTEPMIYFDFLIKRLPAWEQAEFYEKHWLSIPEEDKFMYPEKAIPLVQKGGFAYHAHPDASYPIIDRTFSFREICELMEVHIQHPVFATLAITYNSSFVEITKIGFAKISEVGIRSRQLSRWSSKKPTCRKDIINVSSTDIYEFAPHLIVLLFGMILAIFLLFFEILIANYKNIKMKCKTLEICS